MKSNDWGKLSKLPLDFCLFYDQIDKITEDKLKIAKYVAEKTSPIEKWLNSAIDLKHLS